MNMPPIVKTLLTSRRFWAAAAVISVPILNEKFGWGLSEEVFITSAIAVVGWILGESVRSSEGPKASA
jgi:hypothetical protein